MNNKIKKQFHNYLDKLKYNVNIIPSSNLDKINQIHPSGGFNLKYFWLSFLLTKHKNLFMCNEIIQIDRSYSIYNIVNKFDINQFSFLTNSEKTFYKKQQKIINNYQLSSQKSLIALRLDLTYHFVMVIYNTKTNKLFLFDPLGNGFIILNKSTNILKRLLSIIKQILQKHTNNDLSKIKLEEFIKSCPKLGPQQFNGQNIVSLNIFKNLKNKIDKMLNFDDKYKIKGYCVVWSFFLLHLQCKFQDLDLQYILSSLINENNIIYLFFIIRHFYYQFLSFKINIIKPNIFSHPLKKKGVLTKGKIIDKNTKHLQKLINETYRKYSYINNNNYNKPIFWGALKSLIKNQKIFETMFMNLNIQHMKFNRMVYLIHQIAKYVLSNLNNVTRNKIIINVNTLLNKWKKQYRITNNTNTNKENRDYLIKEILNVLKTKII